MFVLDRKFVLGVVFVPTSKKKNEDFMLRWTAFFRQKSTFLIAFLNENGAKSKKKQVFACDLLLYSKI